MLSVDRIEGDTVVCQDEKGVQCTLSLGTFREKIRENDLLYQCPAGVWHVDAAATASRVNRLKSRLSALAKGNDSI